MSAFLKALIGFSLNNRVFVLAATVLLVVAGVLSYRATVIDAFPDVTNTQVTIITQWPGRGAEEIEKFVTIPIEVAVNGVPGKTALRSTTLFGLSVVRIIFDDGVDDFQARQLVANMLQAADLPEGLRAEIQPPYGPTGEIMRYTLRSNDMGVRDLKTIQDWVIERRLRAVNGVADIVSFGGEVKTYEVGVDPRLLAKYDLTPVAVYNALTRSNINVGGDVIERSNQAYVVRGIGLLTKIADIENVVVDYVAGVPVLVRHVATVKESRAPRLGQVGLNQRGDVVEGIVIMRKGEDPSTVIANTQACIDDLNARVLPKNIAIDVFYNRQNLIDRCIGTVSHNIVEGIVLVTLIILLFMADIRATLIVAAVIPLSLLFAFVCLHAMGMSANLLSIGAIDFGIIVDGAVVMVEGMFVALDKLGHSIGMERFNQRSKRGLLRAVGTELGTSILFAKIIIIICLIPLFAFSKVEGRLFTPLAWTLSFALLGALLLSLTLVPVLVNMAMNRNVRERSNPLVNGIRRGLLFLYDRLAASRRLAVIGTAAIVVVGLAAGGLLGTEFLPQLNEGAMYVRANLPLSVSLDQAVRWTQTMRTSIGAFPEVRNVMSQTGRPNDGTDPTGFYNVEFHVDLHPEETWTTGRSREQLTVAMKNALSVVPGVDFNISQPIMDNVEEAVSGVKGSIAVKVFGEDLAALERYAEQVERELRSVDGIADLGIIRNLGQPELRIEPSDARMAVHGVTTADAASVIEMAIGGKVASHFYEGERKFDIRVRYQEPFRSTDADIDALRVPTLHGTTIPLKEIASVRSVAGPLLVYRDGNERFCAVKFSVRGRDMGSTVAEARERVGKALSMPKGYSLVWTGDFENQDRAVRTLMVSVPVSFFLVFLVLLGSTSSLRDSLLILFNIPFAVIGGIAGLLITGTNFSISAGIGFIALSGICILNGVILTSVFHTNMRRGKMSLADAIRSGVNERIRPIVMTALMGMLGLLPAAMSTGIGSDAQRPLAIVVVAGFVTATLLSLLVFPQLFYLAYHRRSHRP